MAIAHVATGSAVATTTGTISPAISGTAVAGELLVAYVTARYSSASIPVRAGWTLVSPTSIAGGTGTDAADTGTTNAWILIKHAVGGETGAQAITIVGNAHQAVISRFSKDSGKFWGLESTGGVDTSIGDTAYSATGSAISLQTDDVLLTATVSATDTPTFASKALSASGITFGSGTADVADFSTTSGSDQRAGLWRQTVTAGTGSGSVAPTMALTASAAAGSAGSTVFLRLREIDAPTFVAEIGMQPGTTSVGLSWPGGQASGDMAVAWVGNKPETITPGTPTDWTQITTQVVGTGSAGEDTGQLRVTAFYRELNTGSPTDPVFDLTGANVGTGGGMIFHKASGSWATPTASIGDDNTSGTGFSATGSDIDVAAGDQTLAVGIGTRNLSISSGRALTIPGCALDYFGISSGGTTNGNNIFGWVDRAQAFSGPQSGGATIAATFGNSTSGGGLLIRVALSAGATDLVVAGSSQTQVSDNAALVQDHTLVVAASSETTVSDSPTLVQNSSLVVADAAQATTSDAVEMNQRVRNYTFEEGSQGAAPTVAGNYAALTGTVVYDSAAAAHGSLGLTSTNNSFLTVLTGTPDTGAWSVHFTPVAVTTGVPRVLTLTDASNVFIYTFRTHTDGKFDVADGSSTRQASSTATWSAGTKYWATGTLTGTGTSRTASVNVYTDDGNLTPVWSSGNVAVTAATSSAWARARLGSQGATAGSQRVDDARFYDVPAFAEPLDPSTSATLVVSDATQAQVSDSATLTQDHTLAVDASTQATTSDAVTLVYNSSLTVADATSAQVSDGVTLTQDHVLAVDAALQAQVAGALGLVEESTLTVAAASQAQVADGVALVQDHVLVVAASTQAQVVDAVTLVYNSSLIMQDAAQAQVSGTGSLTQDHALTVDGAASTQVTGSPALTQDHQLVPADAAQAVTSDALTLSSEAFLTPADASQTQLVESVTVTQDHQLTVADAAQAQSTDAVTLVPVLVVSGAAQSQVAGSPVLVEESGVAAQDALQSTSSTAVTLTQDHVLTVSSAGQSQVAGVVGVTSETNLVAQDAAQAQVVDHVTLTQEHVLVSQSAVQGQVSGMVSLEAEITLTVPAAAQSLTSGQVPLSLTDDLTVQDAAHGVRAARVPLNGVRDVGIYMWNGTEKVRVIIHGMDVVTA